MLKYCLSGKSIQSSGNHRQLLEENNILKELFEELQVQRINTDANCERLKIAIDTLAKENLRLHNHIKTLEEVLGKPKSP